jgi:hypothetical protein
MERHELPELHYIAPSCNLASILQHGILCNIGAAAIPHDSVAMQKIQDKRSPKRVPGGQKLHEYVNLYICGRNPMLYKLLNQREQLCVLSVSTDVLDLKGVVVTDGNASSEYVRFAAAPGGLQIVSRELTFAEDWRDPDRIQYYRKKSAKCAEVLVPGSVDPRYLQRVYVCNQEMCRRLQVEGIPVVANGHLFFV